MFKQLECRIVITRHRTADLARRLYEVGMYCPATGRYEGGAMVEGHKLDATVEELKRSIERAGHRLTFCERTA